MRWPWRRRKPVEPGDLLVTSHGDWKIAPYPDDAYWTGLPAEFPDASAPWTVGPAEGETDGTWFTVDADGTRTEHPPVARYYVLNDGTRVYVQADNFRTWP